MGEPGRHGPDDRIDALAARPEPGVDRPREQLIWQFATQARLCPSMGSRLYASLLARAITEDLEDGGPTWRLTSPHAAPDRGNAIALRLLAAVHRLVLTGEAPQLEPFDATSAALARGRSDRIAPAVRSRRGSLFEADTTTVHHDASDATHRGAIHVSTTISTAGDETPRSHPGVPEATGMAGAAAPVLAASAPADRAAWLRAIADALDARVDELATVADEETALGLPRLTGEVGRTSGQLRLFAGVLEEGSCFEVVIDHADPDAAPPKPDLRRMLQPLGPVAVFAASNFPFAFSVVGGDTASALAAGCPVIVKAHPGHPRTSDLTAEIATDALTHGGAPAGTFGVIHGLEAGRELVTDPPIRAVGFTGSLAGGRALFDLAVGRPDPIPFYGELGSLNPVIVTEGAASARPDEIAAGLLGSMTLGVGQFCTKPGIVFVPEDERFLTAIRDAAEDASGGTMLGDRIAQGFGTGLRALADHMDVEVVAGDPVTAVSDRSAAPVVLATGAAQLDANADALLTECFGPTTLLVRYGTQDDLLTGLGALPGSLTATVHAEDTEVDATSELLPLLTGIAGRVIFGGWPTGVAVTWSQHHGGPWPATTAPLHTSVGATAIRRFLRPVSYQDAPLAWLPPAIRDDNPLGIPQRVDGQLRMPEAATGHGTRS